MFGVGFVELFLIALVALVVIGPKDMPALARRAGQLFAKAQKFMLELRTSVIEKNNDRS